MQPRVEKKSVLSGRRVPLVVAGLAASGIVAASVYSHQSLDKATVTSAVEAGQPDMYRVQVGEKVLTRYGANAQGRRTYEEARDFCQARGQEIASIETRAEMDAMSEGAKNLGYGFYMGLHKAINDAKDDWYFVDGAEYTSWTDYGLWHSEGQAKGTHGECSLIWQDGLIHDHPCNENQGFICQDTVDKTMVKLVYRDSFIVAAAQGYGYNAASSFCEQMGSKLAHIKTVAETREIGETMEQIGITQAWLGLYNENGAQWRWEEGSHLASESVPPGSSISSTSADDRVVIDASAGGAVASWKAQSYNSFANGFVCEAYDWALVIEDTGMTFDEANQKCTDYYGTQLASIADAATNDAMRNTLRPFADTTSIAAQAWIGLHDRRGNGDWQWLDERPITFTDWFSGQPDNAGDAEECVHLHRRNDGVIQWNDLGCDDLRNKAYICATVEHTRQVRAGRYIVFDKVATFADAKAFCESNAHTTTLASIADANDNEMVLAATKSLQLAHVWLGLQQTASGQAQFEWLDGSNYGDYTNWEGGASTDLVKGVMNGQTGEWFVQTGNEEYGIICNAQ